MDSSKLFALFDKVKLYRKYPAIVIKQSQTESIKIGMGSDQAVLWVSNNISRNHPMHKLYGKFDRRRNLGFIPYLPIDEYTVGYLLESICADPIKLGKEQGQLYKYCIFCNTELTSKASLFAGYGPSCAKNWGLPWGEVKDESLEHL